MNENIVFVKTDSGEDEARSRTAHLSKDIKRALLMVDGKSTVGEISKRASPSLRALLNDMFIELVKGGFVRDKSRPASPLKMATPQAPLAVPKKMQEEDGELDFTSVFQAATPAVMAEEAVKAAAKLAADADARAQQQRALKEAELVRIKIEQAKAETEERVRAVAAEKAKLEAEVAKLKAQAAAETRAHVEAEELAQKKAEALKLKMQQEADRLAREAELRVQAEREAAKVKVEQEAARVKAEQEAARAKVEQEAKKREQAERRAREEAEAARLKAEQVKAETEARARAVAEEKARLEAEVAKLKAQAETDARIAAEKLAQKEAEAAKIKAQQEAERLAREADERAKAEQEAARFKAQAEAREQAEHRAREDAEAARIKAEQVKAESEARARAVAEEKARLEAEVAKLKAEAEARMAAEVQARRDAETARIKAEQEAAERKVAEEKIAEQKAAEQKAAEQKAAEQKAAEQKAAEQKAAEQKAAEQKAAEQKAAEQKAQHEAEEAELKARLQAERIAEELRLNAEEQARRDADADADAARIKAEQKERRVREEDEAARIAKEAAQLKENTEQAALLSEKLEVQTNEEMLASIVKLNARHEAIEKSVFTALDEQVKKQEAASASIPPVKDRRRAPAAISGSGSRRGGDKVSAVERRTTTAAVVFFDIIGYTKQTDSKQIKLKQQFNHLVTESIGLLDATEHIILDTGDGAAIGFMQHPTDALETATHFRNSLIAHNHADYPEMRVRIGINLGPVSLVKDMNGQTNMLGDGINSAQRVMGFAGDDQIYVSRSYFDFVSSLSDEYESLFRYHGAKADKHGREHQVYELLDAEMESVEPIQEELSVAPESLPEFNFDVFDSKLAQTAVRETPKEQQSVIEQAEATKSKPEEAIVLEQFDVVTPDLQQAVTPVAEPVSVIGVASVEDIKNKPEETRTVETLPLMHQIAASEEEARKLADEQAKKWAEAEQRAAEQARRQSESAARKVSQPAVAVENKPHETPSKIRVRRKPIPWGKIAVGLVVMLVATVFASPYLLLTQTTRTNIEQQLGSKLQQPVHIGGLSGRILPLPRLVLNEVSIGEGKQIHLREVQANFALPALFGLPRTISNLDLDGVQVQGSALPQVYAWLQQLAADRQYPVEHIGLSKGELDAGAVKFSDVSGELSYGPDGKLISAKLNSGGDKLALDIQVTPEQKNQLTVSLRNSAFPLFPNLEFDDMTASGELNADELHITELDAHILGGLISGEARLNWASGWRAEGSLVAKVVPLQSVSKLLEGDMDGSAHFKMQAAILDNLADSFVLNGIFNARKVVISGVDVVESARSGHRENAPGGRTHFDKLSGELAYANGNLQFRQLRMSDSVVNASGMLTVHDHKLSGVLTANLAILTGSGSTSLLIGGTTESPTFKSR